MGDAIQIKVERKISALSHDWDEYAGAHPQSSIFHLSSWARLMEATFSYSPLYCVAYRGGRVCGILPLFCVKNLPFGRSLVSLPFAVYGGVRADDSESAEALLEYARKLGEEMGAKYVELRHESAIGELPVKDLYVTFRKEIYEDEEKNLAAIPRKQRRMIRQGEKFGLEARVGREDMVEEFYHVYSESVRNLGTPVFPRQLFRGMLTEYGEQCQILGVFREGRMVAGVMTLFFRDQVMPYYGGALAGEFRYAVSDFMYWRLLCDGAKRGFKVFDFGRSKVGTGAFDFKRHWGFEPTPLQYQYILTNQKTLPNLSPANPKLALLIEMWKRCPVPVSQWLGPRVIQFFP